MPFQAMGKFNRIINKPIDISRMTAALFFLHAVTFVIGFMILGPSPQINGQSILIVVFIDFIFCAALLTSSTRSAPVILVYSWLMIIFSLVRLTSLLFLTPQTIVFLTSDGLSDEEYFQGLLLYSVGVFALLFGVYIADHFFLRKHIQKNVVTKLFSLWSITAYWFLTYLAAYFIKVQLGIGIFSVPEDWGSRWGWLVLIFDTDVALFITLCWAFIKFKDKTLTTKQIIHISILIILWLLFSILIGSRGGILRLFLFSFFVLIAINPNFRLSFLRLVIAIIAFSFSSFATFEIASTLRFASSGAISLSDANKNYRDLTNYQNISNISNTSNISDLRRIYYEKESVKKISNIMKPIVERLSILDYSITILVKIPKEEVVDHYIRSSYVFKNFANNLVPGEIFDEAVISTSRIFIVAYRGFSIEHIQNAFMSEPWTIIGLAWLLGKYWGTIILLCLGFCIQSLFNVISSQNCRYSIYLQCSFLITVVCTSFLIFGVDHYLTFIAHFSLATLIALAILELFDLILRKSGLYKSILQV